MRFKDSFAPFDPDTQTRPLKPLSLDQKEKRLDQLFAEFTSLMERANFKRLTKADVEAAMEGGASDWGINMEVDFNVFERLELFMRGDGKSTRIKKHPIFNQAGKSVSVGRLADERIVASGELNRASMAGIRPDEDPRSA